MDFRKVEYLGINRYFTIFAPMQQMHSIDDVLHELDRIIIHCVERNSRLGAFAWVYRMTTDRIKSSLKSGHFDNPEFLEAFDVAFAKRYVEAYWDFRANKPVTRAWEKAFEAENQPITLMQHILLGMNAHINLDLGIVAAELRPGELIHGFRRDFMRVNDILRHLIDDMQFRLSRIYLLMNAMDRLGGRKDEAYIYFNIRKARQFAWDTALSLAPLEENELVHGIDQVDQQVATLATVIQRPPRKAFRLSLRCVAFFEQRDMRHIIDSLSRPPAREQQFSDI